MELLGHSQIRTTLDIYSHVMPALARDPADRMGALLLTNDPGKGRPTATTESPGPGHTEECPGERGGAEGTRNPVLTLPGRHDHVRTGSPSFRKGFHPGLGTCTKDVEPSRTRSIATTIATSAWPRWAVLISECKDSRSLATVPSLHPPGVSRTVAGHWPCPQNGGTGRHGAWPSPVDGPQTGVRGRSPRLRPSAAEDDDVIDVASGSSSPMRNAPGSSTGGWLLVRGQ